MKDTSYYGGGCIEANYPTVEYAKFEVIFGENEN
jgi:hypothetical protein